MKLDPRTLFSGERDSIFIDRMITMNGVVYGVDMDTFLSSRGLRVRMEGRIWDICFHQGQLLMIIGNDIVVVDPDTGTIQSRWPHAQSIVRIKSHRGALLFLEEKRVTRRTTLQDEQEEILICFDTPEAMQCMDCFDDFIVVGGVNHCVHLYNMVTTKLMWTVFPPFVDTDTPIFFSKITFSPNGVFMIAEDHQFDNFFVIDAATGKQDDGWWTEPSRFEYQSSVPPFLKNHSVYYMDHMNVIQRYTFRPWVLQQVRSLVHHQSCKMMILKRVIHKLLA